MGYVKAGEVVVRVPLPEQMRDDLKSIAALDGISMKAWIAMHLNIELAARSDELKELKARRSKLVTTGAIRCFKGLNYCNIIQLLEFTKISFINNACHTKKPPILLGAFLCVF